MAVGAKIIRLTPTRRSVLDLALTHKLAVLCMQQQQQLHQLLPSGHTPPHKLSAVACSRAAARLLAHLDAAGI
jgi:hypothetical protein